nr:hypothetical protein [Tanacetum cinerariifolium]
MKEIDLFCTPDYPMLPSIVDKDYDSERDILIPKDLPNNNTLSFAEKESFYFDIPPFSHPPTKPPDEIVSDISNADIKSFSPSHILNSDSDPLMEEIDLYFNSDDPMPPGIEEDDDDSERDIPILEELLEIYSLSLPTNESYHFDIPSPHRPPAKPPDGNT